MLSFFIPHTKRWVCLLLHLLFVMGHMFLCCLARGHTWKRCSDKCISFWKCVFLTYLFIPTTPLQYWLSQESHNFLRAFSYPKRRKCLFYRLRWNPTIFTTEGPLVLFFFFFFWCVYYLSWVCSSRVFSLNFTFSFIFCLLVCCVSTGSAFLKQQTWHALCNKSIPSNIYH